MHQNSLSSELVTAHQMRNVLAGFPTGLVLVAADVEDRIVGLSANSFTSVSLDPPLVSISFAHTSTSWPVLRKAPRWGVSVLGEQQAHVLQELRLPAQERFSRLDMHVESGAAFVAGALARLTVELDTEIEAGDHALTLLRVLELHRDAEQHPLIFFGSGAHRLAR
jgi:flavin reductase (DIM6/NTAB) family NADH-FMN oxidoreductase RutF